jgi:ABC-type lipoprotein export system ATPase subunit
MKIDCEKLIREETLDAILNEYPIGYDYLENLRLTYLDRNKIFKEALAEIDEEDLFDFGLTREEVLGGFVSFLSKLLNADSSLKPISTITIIGGYDKSGIPENIKLSISTGEIISIVGPTGSGKSRLLEDIECLAQKDTPTKRQILIDHNAVDDETRFELDGKLIAQLSQNMNFVMDLSVKEFLELHAKSRLKQNTDEIVKKCFHYANNLAGEKFLLDTKVTQLSGGQSRALMIADTAFMSESPIVLIDEIENAGINRKEAVELLSKKEKIIFISTHDPLLALNADKRIVINNGGISKIITTSPEEKKSLLEIGVLDSIIQDIREDLRYGNTIKTDFKIIK